MEHERLTKKEVIKEIGYKQHSPESCPGIPCSTECDHVENLNVQVKQLSNNTFEVTYPNGDRAIRYHHTDIITYHPNGDIVLNTNGWLTSTIKERMGYLSETGYSIQQVNKIWYLVNRLTGQEWTYQDGITIHPNGEISGNGTNPKELLKVDKQIKGYIEGFIKALFDGKIEKPGHGDCWGCLMKNVKTGKPVMGSDHLLDHFREKYYVPSLLMNAIEAFPVSIVARESIGYYLDYHDQNSTMFNVITFNEITKSQVRSSLRRYLRRQLGIAA